MSKHYEKLQGLFDQVKTLTSGERAEQHGDFIQNMHNMAKLIQGYINAVIKRQNGRNAEPIWLEGADAALIVALIKIARTQTGSFNPDDYVDLVGYGGIAGICAEANMPQPAPQGPVDAVVQQAKTSTLEADMEELKKGLLTLKREVVAMARQGASEQQKGRLKAPRKAWRKRR